MIYIGVTGWGDHDRLYPGKISPRDKLKEYAAHFPTVEVDASFYAVQSKRNTEKWVSETPSSFQFIVKAYQGMTGHQRGESPYESKKEMFAAFDDSLQAFRETNKLSMVLFQFPPWFNCKKENVDYLRWCKQEMGDTPVALEFRNQTWYESRYYDQTLAFIEEEGWIHTVCDEPQAGEGSIPIVLKATDLDKALVRFHGRNVHGWKKQSGGNWREVRYLYRYNQQELEEWAEKLHILEKQSKNIYVLFNNNSGGDAADNAKQMIDLLSIKYEGLAPRQLDLF
ncbi:DUF72 domain-containing protein [Peribacillus cavernae]|uniref:DUF72 domain-containing protein n=1 Tax=Peribacillus cavernae TaxID=1674310 RepID=A0A433HC13_9BACI|nr:DUF72 domain-containing protein [Peribacillus cavernae]MDQ0219670.1 uncharacterized protein YecE (DUF72 family) [Peribacillus cavernae]RUQ25950.1 DUF72 domain-containing protein [Peribacillus cavernae]